MSDSIDQTRSATIARLNDEMRASIVTRQGPAPNVALLTGAISALEMDEKVDLMRRVAEFDDFTEDNNPHGERDFGSFEYGSEKVFWKIDYFDLNLEFGSEDPTNSKVTRRVLSIFYAQDY